MDPPNRIAELPAACSLQAADGAGRVRRWRELISAARPQAARRPGALELRWRLDARGLRELEALVAAERECCGFVIWGLDAERDGALLTITARPGRPGDVDAIVALFETP